MSGGVLPLSWYLETGQKILDIYRHLMDLVLLEITVDGGFLNELWERIFATAGPFPSDPFNISIWSLMFGEAILVFLLIVMIKFVLDTVL